MNLHDWTDSGKIEEEEKLRPEELNQQNIEALLAETNLVCLYLFYSSKLNMTISTMRFTCNSFVSGNSERTMVHYGL